MEINFRNWSKSYWILGIAIIIVAIVSIFTYEVQTAYAGIPGLDSILPVVIGIILGVVLGLLQSVIVDAILGNQELTAQQEIDQYFAHPTFGFAAIKAIIVINNQLLEDSDFGLNAQTNDPDYGLKRIADDIQDSDFGLDAQTNDPIYGLKRIASDIQHVDWGLEVIDDEIELIDETIEKQVTKQRVSISVMKSSYSI